MSLTKERTLRLMVLMLAINSCCGVWNTNDYLRREHSLTKPYQAGGVSMPNWDFVGTTMVTNQFIRLTYDRQSQKGAIWNSVPLMIRNWELHVHFKIYGVGKDLFGDGMAIWYARDRFQLGPVFGNADAFSGLGIFIDTYSNHNGPHHHGHPYISAMVSNGSLQYDHDTDGTHTQLAGCEAQLRNKDHDTYVAIRYENNVLKVSMDIEGKGGWTLCFEKSGVHLPTGYYFGASAATGDLADNHDILSMKLYELDNEGPENEPGQYLNVVPSSEESEPPRERVDDAKRGGGLSGWKLLFVIFLLIVGVGVCALVGFVIYSNKDSYSKKKRFY